MVCNSCGSISPTPIYNAEYGNIELCHICGLVFRNHIGPTRNHYAKYDRMYNESHKKRFKKTASYLSARSVVSGDCLDIGSGTGDFVAMVNDAGARTCTAIEPSTPLIDGLTKRVKGLKVYNGYVDEFVSPTKFDLITALGCHYLFKDHSKTMEKIAGLLSESGVFYFDSNAFLDMRSFVGSHSKVITAEDLFNSNSMLNWWFTEVGLKMQVEKYFTIVDEKKEFYDGVYFLGLLCRGKDLKGTVPMTNNADYAKMTLNKLGIIV